MAVQAETITETEQLETEENKQRYANTSAWNWEEDSPSYLTGIQALLDSLTEEDKDALHASLQE